MIHSQGREEKKKQTKQFKVFREAHMSLRSKKHILRDEGLVEGNTINGEELN